MTNMMKKALLASALALSATSALAVVNLNDDTGTAVFATEIAVPSSGRDLTNAGNVLDVAVQLGFSTAAGTSNFVRFDLGASARFGAVPTLTGTNVVATLSSGGNGQSFVIFEITGNDGDDPVALPATTLLTLAAATYTVVSESPVTASYALYGQASAAINQTANTSLATESGTLLSFSSALAVSAATVTPAQIDVSFESRRFVGGTEGVVMTTVGNISVGVTTMPSTPLWIDGEAAALTDIVAAGTSLVVSGDISAGLKVGGTGTDAGDVAPGALVLNSGTPAANPISPSGATYPLGTMALTSALLVYTVDGETPINETVFTAVYDVTAATDSDAQDISLALSRLTKNGSTADIALALTPGGVFPNFIRITNTSGISGNVSVTLTNDQGDSATFPLGDVVGQVSALTGQNSTSLISISELYAAAQAAVAAFEVGPAPANKLRIRVEGEFPSINAQSVSVATDGTSFSSLPTSTP